VDRQYLLSFWLIYTLPKNIHIDQDVIGGPNCSILGNMVSYRLLFLDSLTSLLEDFAVTDILSVFISGWGIHNEQGCPDRSDIIMDMNESDECGIKYEYIQHKYVSYQNWFVKKETDLSWKWFSCYKTGKCIHAHSRCDLHPHPDCIYKNEAGQMVAEDEEGCFDEYKYKGLVPKSANFECQSAIHNSGTIAIQADIVKFHEGELVLFYVKRPNNVNISFSSYGQPMFVTIMCRNDELSLRMS
jgi:hypothetical protein